MINGIRLLRIKSTLPLLILISACQFYSPKIDTTSEEHFWNSKKRIEATLSKDEKNKFKKAERYIRALYTNTENKQIKGPKHKRILQFMQFMHHKSAKDIINSAKKLQKKYGKIKQ